MITNITQIIVPIIMVIVLSLGIISFLFTNRRYFPWQIVKKPRLLPGEERGKKEYEVIDALDDLHLYRMYKRFFGFDWCILRRKNPEHPGLKINLKRNPNDPDLYKQEILHRSDHPEVEGKSSMQAWKEKFGLLNTYGKERK